MALQAAMHRVSEAFDKLQTYPAGECSPAGFARLLQELSRNVITYG
jgi:hypothetical protein